MATGWKKGRGKRSQQMKHEHITAPTVLFATP
jgi:hypothetical protein